MKFRLGTYIIFGQFLVLLGLFNQAFAAAGDVFESRNLQPESRNGAQDSSGSTIAPGPEAGFFKSVMNALKLGLRTVLDAVIVTQIAPSRGLENKDVCYNETGCFNLTQRMRLDIGAPQGPEEVDATFYFFDNASSDDIEKLLDKDKNDSIPERTWNVSNWTFAAMNGTLDTSKPLAVLTHGLTGSKRTPWMKRLVKAILENLNCTVLVVDWHKGADGHWADAAVNTPMAGVLTSLFLQKVINETNCTIHPRNVTLVGFSMGGQVMGFVGRHYRNSTGMAIGRIAGLDPAGHLFAGKNYCLSKSDADYVDVIHTHGGSIYDLKIGLSEPVGHVDFYPNGGVRQAGCPETPSVSNIWDSFTCSHYRAPELFIESLNTSTLPFVSYHCNNWTEFENKKCFEHYNISSSGQMGYYSKRATGRGLQYLYTNAQSPYARGNNTEPPGNNTNPAVTEKP